MKFSNCEGTEQLSSLQERRVDQLRENRSIRRVLTVILLLFVLFLYQGELPVKGAHVYTHNGEYDLTLNISYGYEGVVKYGRFMPVSVTIENRGEEFRGWLKVLVPRVDKNVMYSNEIQLPAGESTEVKMNIPVSEDTGLLHVKLVNEKEKTVIEENFNLTIGNHKKEAYIGVLSDNDEGVNYLDSVDTRVFLLEPGDIQEDYLSLDLLDIIVINQFDTRELKEAQLKSLESWIVDGGTLVLGTGEYSEPVLSNISERFGVNQVNIEDTALAEVTIQVSETEIEDMTGQINRHVETSKIITENIKSRNRMLEQKGFHLIPSDFAAVGEEGRALIGQLSETSLTKLSASLSGEGFAGTLLYDNKKVLLRKELGRGSLLVFSIDLNLQEENITIGRVLLSNLLNGVSTVKKQQLDMEYYGGQFLYGIISSIYYDDMTKIPNLWLYGAVMFLYIIIVIPLSFYLLKRIDKRNYFPITVLGTALLFTAIVYGMGGKTRISKPYSGYLELITFNEGDTVLDEVYFSLTTSYNNPLSTAVDNNYPITELRDSGYNYEMESLNPKKRQNLYKYVSSIKKTEDSTTIETRRLPAFSTLHYQLKDSYKGSNKVESDLNYFGKTVEGTIRNGFDFDIYNGILITNGYVTYLDELKQGEEIRLSEKESHFFMVASELYESDFITRITGGDPSKTYQSGDARRRNSLFHYIIDSSTDQLYGSYILGFLSEGGEDLSNPFLSRLKDTVDSQGMRAVVLPVTVNYEKDNKVFIPTIDPYIRMSDGYNNGRLEARYLYDENHIIEYVFPKEDRILSFELLSTRNPESSLEYLTSFKGNIYFYNHQSKVYDKVFADGDLDKAVNGKDYVSKEGKLVVKYDVDISIRGSSVITPNISCWKEVPHGSD